MDRIHNTTSIENATAYRIHHTARLLRYSLNQFFQNYGVEISLEQWFILFKLFERDGQAQSELADKDLNDHPNITRLVDALQKRDMIRRDADPNDRRKSLVYLTERAHTFMEDILPAIIEERKRIFNGLSNEEIEQFLQTLEKIEANALNA
ncbi:MAG: MarR family transcriptional regulator [Anaerolineae bacterium]|nr:MarR family transcriptional regulator [Anaerolineae bacterium]